MSIIKHLLSLTLTLSASTIVFAADDGVAMPHQPQNSGAPTECKSNNDWSEPTYARHIYGNVWYVGTCGISVILVATPRGHFLIDGATEAAVPAIEANITSLGVKLSDIKYILTTHEHLDHVGGVAKLQADSGATVISRSAAANALKSGKTNPRDPQHQSIADFTPIANLKTIPDQGKLTLGTTSVHNIPMTGHTPGGSGWTWQECENGKCVNMLFSDSVGSISNNVYHFSRADSMAKPLLATTKRLAKMPCDILITGHVFQSNLFERLDGKVPLIDDQACKNLAKSGQENLQIRLQDEKLGKKP
jgi:metallo-beta-lactamase class B